MPKKNLTIDMGGKYNPKYAQFIVRELDALTLTLNVVDGSEPFDLTNATVKVYGLRTDGERPLQSNIEVTQDGELNIKLNNSFNCAKGINFLELEVTKDEEVFTSPSIPFLVEPRLKNELSFEATSLDQIVSATEKYLKELEEGIQRAVEQLKTLDNKHQEMIEWEKGFNINETLPTMQSDIKYLKEKPISIRVY